MQIKHAVLLLYSGPKTFKGTPQNDYWSYFLSHILTFYWDSSHLISINNDELQPGPKIPAFNYIIVASIFHPHDTHPVLRYLQYIFTSEDLTLNIERALTHGFNW